MCAIDPWVAPSPAGLAGRPQARVEHLERIGTTPGEATRELLNTLRFPGVTTAEQLLETARDGLSPA